MLPKHQLFVNYFLGEAKADVTQAARLAGYKYPNVNGQRIVKRPDVAAAIKKALERHALKAEDVLLGLADHANGSMEDFTNVDATTGRVELDFRKAQRLGRMRLIKKLTIKADGSTSVELYDAQSAMTTIGKALGLFTERVQVELTDNRDHIREKLLARLSERLSIPSNN